MKGVDAASEIDAGAVRLVRWGRIDPDAAWRAVSESLEHVGPWMTWARPDYSAADAEAFRAGCDARWGDDFDYAIVAPGGDVVGSCSLMRRSGGIYEIGYWLHPAHLGRGLMTAAVREVADEAFRIGARAVEIVHDEANERSGGVPLRLGFTDVERRPGAEAPAPADSGVDVVWRLRAP